MKKILLSPWTALLTLALVVGIRVADPTFVESVRLRYFDTLITSKAPTDNNIYTVNIDEATIDKYGQYPFPRDKYAEIIDSLYAHNAGLVVFDVLLSEPDRFGKDHVLETVMRTEQNVVLPSIPSNQTKNNPRAPGSAVIGTESGGTIVQYPGLIANIPKLENVAGGVGIVSTLPEVDGVNRRIPLIVSVDGKIYPGLSLEALRVATGNTTFQVKLSDLGVEKMRLPGDIGIIDTDSLGRIWIDWSQKTKSVSASNLPEDFGGAIVVVGVTAAGVANPVPTSIGSVWPQDVQAAVMATMINRVVIQRPAWADGAEIIALVVAGIVLLFLTRWTYVGLISGILIIGGAIPISRYFFAHSLQLVDASFMVGGLVLVMLHAYGVKFVSEFLQKQQIKRQFGTYLSPAMVEKLQRDPGLLRLGGDSRELSIMFTDVRGFTTISEHYGEDVQGLTKIMNRYMTAMTAKIIENNGTLDKYIGDAQMAFWNAPLDDPDHALHAVETALQMMESLDEFNKEITLEGIPAFGMGLGINTGVVVVGNMGSDQRFDYTCLGDSVNLASRLEGQSKPYGVRIVLGAKTAEYVKHKYAVCELDCIAVKGKTEGVRIFTLAPDNEQHQQFLDLYYRGEWKKALTLIPLCKNATPELEHYYDNMAERLAEGKPSNWDGTFRATSK